MTRILISRGLPIVFGIVLLTVLGVTLAIAGPVERSLSGPISDAIVQPPAISGQTAGSCRMGYQTAADSVFPVNESGVNNPPAASVSIKKTCLGPVVGSFTAHVFNQSSITLDMRATCVGTGGQTDPCTIGDEVFASPGQTTIADGQTLTGTFGMTMVWANLKRGEWRFDVLAGSNDFDTNPPTSIAARTFVVEAFKKG